MAVPAMVGHVMFAPLAVKAIVSTIAIGSRRAGKVSSARTAWSAALALVLAMVLATLSADRVALLSV